MRGDRFYCLRPCFCLYSGTSIFSFLSFAICLLPFTLSASTLSQQFDAQRAFSHVQKQVEFGPRPSGSTQLQQTREYLITQLRSYGLDVHEQPFEDQTARGPIRFVNIIATLPRSFFSSVFNQKPHTILIASHYDTKWIPNIRFVGANDSASSTGVLLEIARLIAKPQFQPSHSHIEFVLFDGEEATHNYQLSENNGPQDGLHGSRYYVKQAKQKAKDNTLSEIQAIILMDMIGDRDLSIQVPSGDSNLMKRLFDASTVLGLRDFFHYSPQPIIDDHVPFVLERVPTIDLIDFDYGPHNRWWHTEEDTLDKINPQSLKVVGQTVLKILEEF